MIAPPKRLDLSRFLLIWQCAIGVVSNDILNYSIKDFVLQRVFEIYGSKSNHSSGDTPTHKNAPSASNLPPRKRIHSRTASSFIRILTMSSARSLADHFKRIDLFTTTELVKTSESFCFHIEIPFLNLLVSAYLLYNIFYTQKGKRRKPQGFLFDDMRHHVDSIGLLRAFDQTRIYPFS